MTTLLVTGGTGTLGRPTVARLSAAGHDVRVLSRSSGVRGDLDTGAGLPEALAGIHTVVHLATLANSKDVAQTRTLLAAATAAGVSHIVYISIVGVDRIPFAYYVAKLECEKLVAESGIPFTILRATQFHEFLGRFLGAFRRSPVLFGLDVPVQPIAVDEVAERLAQLASAEPAGRVADIGGPERGQYRQFAAQWQSAHGTHKPAWMLRLPGKTFAAYRAGRHMTPPPGYGRETFAEFATHEAGK